MKSYTDISQSKKLAEILPLESADMYYPWYIEEDGDTIESGHRINTPDIGNFITHKVNKMILPCWSLAALLSLMPRIAHLKPLINLSPLNPVLNSEEVSIYYNSENFISPYIIKDNLIDACYEMILELHKLNLI